MTISAVAKKYIGQRELKGNTGWLDKAFEKLMIAVGWKSTESYCAYFGELCAKEAQPERFKEFDKLFSAGAVKTFQNFKAAGYKITDYPVENAIVVWQMYKDGKPTWQGHLGICSKAKDKINFETIEANTNSSGSREGTIVAEKIRTVKKVNNGLNILGFIEL